MARARRIDARLQECLERAVVLAQHLAGVRDRVLHGLRRLHADGQAAEKRVIHVRRRLELALALEEPSLVQQRGEIAGICKQRLLQRLALGGLVAQLAMGEGQIYPQQWCRRIEHRRALEQRARGTGVPRCERAHASHVQHAGMIGGKRARLCQRALGLGAVSRLVGAVDRFHERVDLGFADCCHMNRRRILKSKEGRLCARFGSLPSRF